MQKINSTKLHIFHFLNFLPPFPDGMEHWGFITFRETSLLIDPARSNPQAQKTVTLIVCHEIAHQWFGNLVTMRSWTDLWLNEGFANFLMYKCAMVCEPGLVDSTEFIFSELSRALEVDALHSTHALKVREMKSTYILAIRAFIVQYANTR